MLLVFIGVYIKSVMRCNTVIFGASHPDILYLREQRCEDP